MGQGSVSNCQRLQPNPFRQNQKHFKHLPEGGTCLYNKISPTGQLSFALAYREWPNLCTQLQNGCNLGSSQRNGKPRKTKAWLLRRIHQEIDVQGWTPCLISLTKSFQIPGAGFLTNEEDVLISLPYFQNCKKRKDVPILMAVEKGSVYYKKCQKDNVIIGSLVGRPLAWAQHDDENTAFRQCMARIR